MFDFVFFFFASGFRVSINLVGITGNIGGRNGGVGIYRWVEERLVKEKRKGFLGFI